MGSPKGFSPRRRPTLRLRCANIILATSRHPAPAHRPGGPIRNDFPQDFYRLAGGCPNRGFNRAGLRQLGSDCYPKRHGNDNGNGSAHRYGHCCHHTASRQDAYQKGTYQKDTRNTRTYLDPRPDLDTRADLDTRTHLHPDAYLYPDAYLGANSDNPSDTDANAKADRYAASNADTNADPNTSSYAHPHAYAAAAMGNTQQPCVRIAGTGNPGTARRSKAWLAVGSRLPRKNEHRHHADHLHFY